jgi:hypothetical protein
MPSKPTLTTPTNERCSAAPSADRHSLTAVAYTYRDELHRREEDKRLRTTGDATWVIAGLTLANTALVAFAPGE